MARRKSNLFEEDYIKTSRRISREEEIFEHGKQIRHSHSIHNSKKKYSRKNNKISIRDI